MPLHWLHVVLTNAVTREVMERVLEPMWWYVACEALGEPSLAAHERFFWMWTRGCALRGDGDAMAYFWDRAARADGKCRLALVIAALSGGHKNTLRTALRIVAWHPGDAEIDDLQSLAAAFLPHEAHAAADLVRRLCAPRFPRREAGRFGLPSTASAPRLLADFMELEPPPPRRRRWQPHR